MIAWPRITTADKTEFPAASWSAIPAPRPTPNVVQAAAVIRAVAEAYLGDLDQAERLYRVAADTGCGDGTCPSSGHLTVANVTAPIW